MNISARIVLHIGVFLPIVLGLHVQAWTPNEYPVIEGPSDVIKRPGETTQLTCSGSSPVAWDLPRAYEYDDRVSFVSNNVSATVFRKVLILTNVSYMDRQTFVCYLETDPEGGEANVNLYLDDPEHLLTSRSKEMLVYNVNKGMRNVIPSCKPTHPDVKVMLTANGNNVLEMPSWSYTMEEGFVVDPAVTQTHQMYRCTAQRGEKTQVLTIFLIVVVPDVPIRPPTINSSLAQGIPVGGTFILECSAETDILSFFTINWTQPEDVITSGRATIDSKPIYHPHVKKFGAKLTVVNATIEDGLKSYVCTVGFGGGKYPVNDTVSIFTRGQEYIDVRPSDSENITANVSKEDQARWTLDIFGFPKPNTFIWTNSKGAELGTRGKSRFSIVHNAERNELLLIIRPVIMADSGKYQLTVKNSAEVSKTIDLFLTVRDAPSVMLSTNRTFFQYQHAYKFVCRATGYPYPDINWSFRQCEAEDNNQSTCQPYQRIQATHPTMKIAYNDAPRASVQELSFNVPGTGYILCTGNNSIGHNEHTQMVTVIDFLESGNNGFGIHGLNGVADVEPIESDTAIYICSASKLFFTNQIRWFFQNQTDAELLPGVIVSTKTTRWSYHKRLMIDAINQNFSGTYRCEVVAQDGNQSRLSDNIEVSVQQTVPPLITASNLNATKIKTGSTWNIGKLYCKASGVPKPEISWYKDDERIESIPKLQDEVIIGPDFIDFKGLTSEYNGRYTCEATNRIGSTSRYVDVEVQKEANWEMLIIMIGLAIILAVVTVFAGYQFHRDQKMKRWIAKLHLQDFENGDVEKINPNEGISTQVNLLPYDKKYEFPRERLRLGIRIGSGAFGQVVQAEAAGIISTESRTTVAVKMVKPNSDESHFKALMSELKIMIHLGQNLNVVNLLGACTKELVKKRELLVIVEYCKYGSLLSYLHRHRGDFVDQLDRNLDIVDPDIGCPVECHSQMSSPGERLNYAALTFTDSGARVAANGYHTMRELQLEHLGIQVQNGYVRAQPSRTDDYALSTHVQSVCTDMSYLSHSPTVVGGTRKRSTSTSTWTGDYRGVYPYGEVRPITTTDLLCWAFQIANGMDYLVSRNVLHGDLAARNVLLAEKNVVKICDFGLARELCEEKYRKKTEVPLPIKWMALESIYYRVFSTQSDVWSFGVVMWELFTLGKNPYPGMEPDEQFYTLLSQGYRMEKPPYAPSSIYDMMCACWDKEPSNRPSFTTISDRIGDSMQEGLRNHYVDLNAPYLHLNQQRIDEGREDFLEKMRGPDFSSVSKHATPGCSYANLTIDPPPPHQSADGYLIPRPPYQPVYENYTNLGKSDDSRLQCLPNNAGYVYMNIDSLGPEGVFSPRPSQDPSQFTFSTNPPTAISNLNYIPNTIFDESNLPGRGDQVIPAGDGTRHKNDSGVSSIDSNFETNIKKTPPPHPTMWNGGDIIDNSEELRQKKQIQSQNPYLPNHHDIMTTVAE